MKRVLLALALVGMTAGAAWAQIGDGAFILHHPPGLVYTSDVLDYCPLLGAVTCETQNPTLGSAGTDGEVWYIVSNFWGTAHFNACEYGIQYVGDDYLMEHFGTCAPSPFLTIEYPAAGSWPLPGSAIAIALTTTPNWEGTMVTSGWFAGYNYSDTGSITLVPSPLTGFIGWLSDGIMYTAAHVGVLGLGHPGVAVCSEQPVTPYACCIETYTCVMMPVEDCVAQGGVPHDGVVCDNFEPCGQPPVPGACCFGYECQVIFQADCEGQGGTWIGGDCGPDTCGHPPVFACCLADYSCINMETEAECMAAQGTWYGDQNCDTFICPRPPEWACCVGFDCSMLTADACTLAGGVWNEGIACEGTIPCGAPLGACCFGCTGECQVLTEADCLAQSGTFFADDNCDEPSPCILTPAAPDSWGTIKNIYR